MKEGSDLIRFAKEFPRRYFDVAIAEQHADLWRRVWPAKEPSPWWRFTPPFAACL